ncbi:MAG: energy transducer TonB [Bacteroidota bacterium]
MKNSKKNVNSAGQNTIGVKTSQKHDANLQKNSTLYFQIGLILCLLGTYSLFEMQFQDKTIVPETITIDEVATIDVAPDYRLEVVQEEKPRVDRSTTLIDKYEEADNDTPDLEQEIFTPDALETTTEQPLDPGALPEVEEPEEDIFVPFTIIEKVPVYPGCEKKKTNTDKRKCMSQKITKLVNRKFNTSIGEEHGMTGLQKIQTQFTVDKYGNITDVKVRSSHPALEKEARRVIGKIPSMKPGYQRDVPVGVIYTLPIKFQVRN